MFHCQGIKRGLQFWRFFFHDIPDDAGVYSVIVVARNTAELADGMEIDIIRHGGIEPVAKFSGRFRNSFQAAFNGVEGHPVAGKGFFREFPRILLDESNIFQNVMNALSGSPGRQ